MSTNSKVLKIGIMPLKEFQKWTIAVARGEYKPKKDGPKIWFTSLKSLAHVLSEENQQLLKLIVSKQPQSIKELENLTGRKANNLLRTLRTMENSGLVKLVEGRKGRGRAPLIPKLLYEKIDIVINLV